MAEGDILHLRPSARSREKQPLERKADYGDAGTKYVVVLASPGLMVRSVAQRRVSNHGAAPSFETPAFAALRRAPQDEADRRRRTLKENMTTILITGFGPFAGAPYNPTEALVRGLG